MFSCLDKLVSAKDLVRQRAAERHEVRRGELDAGEVQTLGQSYRARARVLSDAEKDEVWDLMRGQIPMIYVYETRTDRNIRVFRLSRIEG